MDPSAERRLSLIGLPSAAVIGATQARALLAGISREGVAMVGGLFRGLDSEKAMRFSFLLSTPVILGCWRTQSARPARSARERHPA